MRLRFFNGGFLDGEPLGEVFGFNGRNHCAGGDFVTRCVANVFDNARYGSVDSNFFDRL